MSRNIAEGDLATTRSAPSFVYVSSSSVSSNKRKIHVIKENFEDDHLEKYNYKNRKRNFVSHAKHS